MQARFTLRTILICCLTIAAFALALVLRLHQAQAPMDYDEFASMYFSGRPFGDLWGWWMLRETNPPLFYSILKLWRMILPESQSTLRVLPLLLSLAQIGLIARFAGKTYGGLSAVLCVLLFALSPSDLFQSEYLRGYVLAKLAVAVSFIGLVSAMEGSDRRTRGWAAYVSGSVVAIYSHTTMLLWPVIASLAALAEWLVCREISRRRLAALALANLAIAVLSSWVLWFAIAQLHTHTSNISWLEPLSLDDYESSANLQLLLDGDISSALMGGLMLVGVLRTFRSRATRLSLIIVAATLFFFKAADRIHPIVSDYTMHWCANFTVLLAAAALADWKRTEKRFLQFAGWIAATAIMVAVTWDSLVELRDDVWIPEPQDFHYTDKTVAGTSHAALLVSHESVGIVVTQSCMLEFHTPACPFPLIVMENPARSDSWAFGGYYGPIIPPREVRAALGPAKTVYVFSRYVYTPLAQLGMGRTRYHVVEWDDGELIGPIPVSDFGNNKAAGAAHRNSRTL